MNIISKFKFLTISCFFIVSFHSYANTNLSIDPNSPKSVDSIIRSLQKEVVNLQIEAKNINKQDNKEQQPSFVMYNNVVVHHNTNENEGIF